MLRVFSLILLLCATSVSLARDHFRCDQSFDQVMHHFEKLQKTLDEAVPREKQVGHMGWLNNMCMYFWRVAHSKSVNHICEVGFGNGFSSTLFLTAGNASMISFDLFPDEGATHVKGKHDMQSYMQYMPKSQGAARRLINHLFPGRFTAYAGSSEFSIPTFIQNNAGYKCDLIYIDGCHEKIPTLNDIRNFRALAHSETIVLFDDLENTAVNGAIQAAVQEHLIHPMLECIEGEVLIDQRFGIAGWTKLDAPGKKFCQSKYVL